MTENQKMEMLVEIEKMLLHDNIAAQKVLQNTLLDTNTTQILKATGDLHMTFLWANMWIFVAAIVFSATLLVAFRVIYKSARKELFASIYQMIQVAQKDIEPLAEVMKGSNRLLSSYVSTLHEHTGAVENSITRFEKKIDLKTQEMTKTIQNIADEAFKAIQASQKIQKALEEEIEANKILRQEVRKQRSILEKKEKKIIALSGVGYQ